MTLNLSKHDMLKRLEHKQQIIPKAELTLRIVESMERSLNFLSKLINGEHTGLERDIWKKNLTNPMLWEFGHVLFFWEHKTLRFLEQDEYITDILSLKDSTDIYDSFVVKYEDRFSIKLNDINEIANKYERTLKHIMNIMNDDEFNHTPITSYLINLSLLHNEMHNESFLFTQKMLYNCMYGDINKFSKPFKLHHREWDEIPVEHKMVAMEGGDFIQGATNDSDYFVFDNEMPAFKVTIPPFKVSKYPVTETQFLEFVEAGGYSEQKYWCKPGWRWKEQDNIVSPVYWVSAGRNRNPEKYILVWTNDGFTKRKPRQDMPMVHVSWYEAQAYCRWKGVRLPTESEWEFMAKNEPVIGNLNYDHGDIIPVNMFDFNNDKPAQLYGNIWEWCEEPIYPYDGFVIDPVYREMSYPFFGFKKICRGGSWACPTYLINPTYRNAQMPDNRIQYTGFRVVEDVNVHQ
jgi:ergothioneine biosynthesis protein EgtB